MDNPVPLSAAVIAHLADGRKIEAIKQLKEEQDLGLKEAKDAVESYITEHPNQFPQQRRTGKGSITTWLIVILLGLLAYKLIFPGL